MKTYTITKTITNYIETKNDKELNKLYKEGVVDEVLFNINISKIRNKYYIL